MCVPVNVGVRALIVCVKVEVREIRSYHNSIYWTTHSTVCDKTMAALTRSTLILLGNFGAYPAKSEGSI